MADEIVGREDEVAELHAFLETAGEGSAAVVLEGEAGIGKSTLWLAAIEAARDRSLRVLTARPAEVEQGLAHAALGDLLGDCAAEVLPELPVPRRRALSSALLLDGGDALPADARALAVAVHNALSVLAERGPIVLAIDDVQWLDSESAAALTFAFRRLDRERVRVLLARRSGAQETALEGAFGGTIARLSIGPLSLGATHGLIRDRLGRTFPRPTMLRLHEVSGGNPFYALELARALDARAGPFDPAAPLPVPDSLERLVGTRLGALPDETRAALLVVAVAGAATTELVEAAGISAQALAPAVAGQVLEIAGGEVRFIHPLLASAVIANATGSDHHRAHRLVATVVDEPVARARHIAAAIDGPHAETAAQLDDAADLARSRGAPSVAAALGEAAARATPSGRADDRHRRLIGAARDHLGSGSTERGLMLARELLPQAEPGPARAETLVLLGDLEAQIGRVMAAVERYRAALADAAGVPELELVIHQKLAADTRVLEPLGVAGAHAQTAVSLAEGLGDDALTARALASLAVVRFNAGHPDSLGLAERALALARQAVDRTAMADASEAYGHCFAWAGRLDEARRVLSEALESAERDDLSLSTPLFYLCLVEERAGRLALARAHAERAQEAAQQEGGHESGNAPTILWSIARVAARQGDVELARELAERTLTHPDARAPSAFNRGSSAVLGLVDAWSGEPARAVERFAAIEVERLASGFATSVLMYHADYVEALLEVGRGGDARAVYADWEADASRFGHRWAIPETVRCRGLVAAAEGDLDAALELLGQAVAEHEAVGDPFGRARALLALGVARRRVRQKRPAREAIEASLAGFEGVGAAGWAERARAELGAIGGRQREQGLTPAERRVATLVAEGRTNREVAAALFLGERTVETHLSHVYAKLGIRSRTELARTLR